MRIFVDTSALFKKYLDEPGEDAFEKILSEATDIAVSPLTWIEMNSGLARLEREGRFSRDEVQQVLREARKDFGSFRHVRWTDALVDKSCDLAQKLRLRTLDSIQLASGVLSYPDSFVTSDRRLHAEASKVLRSVRLV